MRSLREEQRRLQRAVLAHAQPAGPALEAAARIGVYRHAYRARLAGALRANYPKLAQWMGAEEFGELASRYGAAHPSRHFSIRWHGEHLGAFLARGPLAELARMEWALGEAFDAADAAPLRVEDIASMAAEACGRLALTLHASVKILALEWGVEAAWRALRDGETIALPAVRVHSHGLLVWRKDLDAHWRSVTRAEANALLGLHAAGSLDAACEDLHECHAAEMGTWFAGWLAQGMLVLAGARR
jgi:hypothetical protein